MSNIRADLRSLGIETKGLKDEALKEQQRRLEALFYIDQPWRFYYNLLCRPDWRQYLAPLHKEVFEFLNTGKHKKLIELPRGHLKTSLVTAEVTRRIIKNPNMRVHLSNAIVENAKSFLSQIKGYLTRPDIVRLYGDLLPPPNAKFYANNNMELTVMSRTDLALKEPTVSVSGIESAETSQHYDLIVLDDLVTEENISGQEQIEKVLTRYRNSIPLLEPDGKLWVVGTRWHPLDLYGWLEESQVDYRCKENDYTHVPSCTCYFDVMYRQLKENGQYIFPAKFNDEVATELLVDMGRAKFYAQYYNNPSDPAAAWFPHDKVEASLIDGSVFNELVDGKPFRDKLIWYMAVDPAESEASKAAYTAVVCFGVDPSTGIWYVDYAKQAKVATHAFVQLIFDSYNRYKPHKFGMELHSHKSLAYVLKDRMGQTGTYFTIQELKPIIKGGGDYQKKMRIDRIVPLFEHGRIKINKALKDLIEQLYTIPSSRSKDLVDALSYGMDMIPQGIGSQRAIKLPKRYIHWEGTGI